MILIYTQGLQDRVCNLGRQVRPVLEDGCLGHIGAMKKGVRTGVKRLFILKYLQT